MFSRHKCSSSLLYKWRWDIVTERQIKDHLCGLVVRVLGYRSRGPGSIPNATRFSEKKWVWNGAQSPTRVHLRSYLDEKIAALV
jgi:hypothetical protein